MILYKSLLWQINKSLIWNHTPTVCGYVTMLNSSAEEVRFFPLIHHLYCSLFFVSFSTIHLANNCCTDNNFGEFYPQHKFAACLCVFQSLSPSLLLSLSFFFSFCCNMYKLMPQASCKLTFLSSGPQSKAVRDKSRRVLLLQPNQSDLEIYTILIYRHMYIYVYI